MKKIRWGILATGNITRQLAMAIDASPTAELMAVGSRSQEAADRWGVEHGVDRCHGTYEALLDDPDVDAVYIATPNSLHPQNSMDAAAAGKHILCEKPLATNVLVVGEMLDACRKNQVFFLEGFMWRCHPVSKRLVDLVCNGAIGRVRMVESQFGYNLRGMPEHTRMNKALAGGGIMDVGCYPVGAASLVAGANQGLPYAEPLELKAVGHVGETGVDEWTTATLRFEEDLFAVVTCAVQCDLQNVLWIGGEDGSIRLRRPWHADGHIELTRHGREMEIIEVSSSKPRAQHEVEALAKGVHEGRLEAEHPAMTWAESLSQQKILDSWCKTLGLSFDG